MPVEHQVVSIFAAINGFMKDVPPENIGVFEERFIEYMDTYNVSILNKIKTEGKLTEEMEKELVEDILSFKETVKGDLIPANAE